MLASIYRWVTTFLLMFIAACSAVGPKPKAQLPAAHSLSSWTSVTVGVADLDAALELWVGEFGLEIEQRKAGPDRDLATLWSLQPSDITRQALLRTPGQSMGKLHLVEFAHPLPPVRRGAEVFDLVPKNLDIYVNDLPAHFESLKAAGYAFRNETYSEITTESGTTFREIHLLGHDDVNIVLLEVVGESHDYSPKGYSGVGPLIIIVGDAPSEKRFYREGFLLDKLSDNILDGPEIERMVGLPPGAALDVSIWGAADQPLGKVEVIDYQGVQSSNLYPKARAPALGVLHITYQTTDLVSLHQRLISMASKVVQHRAMNTIIGNGDVLTTHSPAGLRIDIFQRD